MGWVSQPVVRVSVGRFSKIDNTYSPYVVGTVSNCAILLCRDMNLDLQFTQVVRV